MKRDLSRLDCSIWDFYGLVQMLVLDRLARIEVSRERAFRKDEYLAKRKLNLAKRKLWPQVVSA